MSLQSEMLKIKQDSEQYGITETKKILQLLKQNQDDTLSKISSLIMKYYTNDGFKMSDYQRYTILVELERQLKNGIDSLSDKQIKTTYEILTDIYKESYYQSAFLIDKGIKAVTNFALLRPEFVKAAIERPIEGKIFSSRIWGNTKNLSNQVKSEVEKALVQGVSPEKLARNIKNVFGSTAYESKRLINTEVAKSVMYAQDQVYQESTAVQKVMWDATLEKNTCEKCEDLDGKSFDKFNHPTCPVHPNCRCCLIPIVSGWQPTVKRENVKGVDGKKKVIDYTSVSAWKKTKLGSE